MKTFEDDVKHLVDKYEIVFGEIFDLKTIKGNVKGRIIPKPKSQYSNILWYKWKLKKTFDKNNLKEEYRENITGIHIMPYRIRKVDVCNAVLKYQGKTGRRITEKFKKKEVAQIKFDEIDFKDNPYYVDYDPQSANFHKLPDLDYQIVLVQGSGPGWEENEIGNIKNNWYFPNIDSSNENGDDNVEKIKNILIDVLKEILVDQSYQNICQLMSKQIY